jgi:hypothetical protein
VALIAAWADGDVALYREDPAAVDHCFVVEAFASPYEHFVGALLPNVLQGVADDYRHVSDVVFTRLQENYSFLLLRDAGRMDTRGSAIR